MFLKNLFSNRGILGINARNLHYLRPYNSKKAIKLADDKIKTKHFLRTRGIPVPKLYAVIKSFKELEKFDFNSLPTSFVIKPNKGYGGEGIIPIVKKEGTYWVTAGGRKYIKEEFVDHIRDILDGRYSISNVGDDAFFEQHIFADERIGKYSFAGLPDIRIVVHNLIPVMAMLRLPTKESQGKANLHQGACAVGIDIGKGEATHIAYKNHIIEELPDGLGKIRGLKIPYWDEILLIASKIQLITNLGYLAADICLDKNVGPILLEINARAGLSVQVANLAPLRKRLQRIEGLKVSTPEKGVRIAKEMFGHTIEKEIKNISGKQIVGVEEQVEIIQKKGTFILQAKIDPNKPRSIIDEELAAKKGLLEDLENYEDEKSTLKLKFSLKNQRIQTVADVEKIPGEKYKFIVGQRDLGDFLIDPKITKQLPSISAPTPTVIQKTHKKTINYSEIDECLTLNDNKIKLLYHLRPLNLSSEKEKFLKDPEINPQFEYPKTKFDPQEIAESLSNLEMDTSPLGKIFNSKREEILDKIELLESMDEENFTTKSIKIFGRQTEEEFNQCLNLLENISKGDEKEEIYSAEMALKKFEEVFENYGLKNWKAKLKDNMVSDCVAGKNNRLFVKSDAKFSHERINALIIHEIETHILTAENGKLQPYDILRIGTANYLITQEGLAIYNVEKKLGNSVNKNIRALGIIVATKFALESSFSETYKKLLELGISKENAFRMTLKVKRGFYDTGKKGAFTKDTIYFRGYTEVKKFVEDGGQIHDLYMGKFNYRDLPNIKKIPGIRPPAILPHWLQN